MRLIDADALYEKTAEWESHAMEQVAKCSPADNRDEWSWWNAVLMERTAFKHDIMDAPTIEPRNRSEWSPDTTYYCPHCGATMQRRDNA